MKQGKSKKYLYFEKDGNLEILSDLKVCVIGYGNQGRSQALNMKDSKIEVIIGNIKDKYSKTAEEDGFKVFSIIEATKIADIILLLIPDETMPKTFKNDIAPNLQKGATVCFASGYNVAFGLIKPPPDVNFLMIAPRMIGLGVRERFLTKEGFYSFICVHQDATGNAKDILLALSKAIGTLKRGGIEVTMKQEAILDLFNEQAFGPAFGRVLLTSINVLLKNGLPPEAVLTEMYLSEEMSFTYKAMARIGLVPQVNLHSNTSQYGSMSRGIKYFGLGRDLEKKFQKTYDNIESGKFAKEWDGKLAKVKFKLIKYFAMKQKINKIEREVRKSLNLPIFDSPVPSDLDAILSKEEFKGEIDEIKNMYNIDEK